MHSIIKERKFQEYDAVFERENSFEPLIVDGTVYFFHTFFNRIFIDLGIKKIALVATSDRSEYALIVKCPYCHADYYQNRLTKKYKCPSCDKKSPIVTTIGEFSNLFIKRINNPAIDNLPYKALDDPQKSEQ